MLLCGCATTGPESGHKIGTDQVIAAPGGYVDYCKRHVDVPECKNK